MKKILQALDTASTKPVEGSNDMKKFLSVVTEGVNPHKVTLPVQMAMQHYAEPAVAKPKTIKEVKKTAMSSMLYQYYTEAQEEVEQEAVAKKELISEQARIIAERVLAKESRVDELSKKTLQSYKGKAEAQVKELEPHAKDGEYKDLAKNAIERRKKGIEKADKKIATKESFNGEYDDEAGMAHGSLYTLKRAVDGLMNTIDDNDNLPEWCQEKISLAEDYLVTVWDYIQSEKAQGNDPEIDETRFGRQDSYDRDVAASQDFSRGHDHRGLEQELAHETNNYAVSINGKSWKVFGSRQEANRVSNAMERKYPDKKIGVHATGAPVSEGTK
jgi:hypothetical protein